MRRLIVLLAVGLLGVMSAQTAVAATQETQTSKWVITTYLWDDGWVEHASWETSSHGDAVKIHIDGWNWPPENPAMSVQYDNLRAFGDVDLPTGPDGLLDDFQDGVIAPFWSIGATPGASVTETGGALRVDIPAGPCLPCGGPPYNHVADAETGFVLHGEFDVQVDFAVDPEFHQSAPFAANAKLFLVDEADNALEASIRSGFYVSLELPAGGSGPGFQHITPTLDQAGRFRIVRTPLTSQLLADLGDAVKGVLPGTSLADKVDKAQAAYEAGDSLRACAVLRAFINEVTAQSGKNIDPSTATSLVADATRIRAALGC